MLPVLGAQVVAGSTLLLRPRAPWVGHSLVGGRHSDPGPHQAAGEASSSSTDQLPDDTGHSSQQQKEYEASSGAVRLPGTDNQPDDRDDITSSRQAEASNHPSEEAAQGTHLRAAPLGRSLAGVLQKGGPNLLRIPKLLMTDTAKAVAQNRLTIQSVQQAWSTSTMKPTTTARIITQAIEALAQPVPVQERDPSDAGWGATVYRVTGGRAPKEILAAALRWTPAERQLHVTTKEALGHLSGAPPPGYQCNHPSVRFNTDSMGLAEQQRQADYQRSSSPGNNLPR